MSVNWEGNPLDKWYKKIDPRDTSILQAQIVQLKLRELEPKETRYRIKKLVHENKIQSQSGVSLSEELFLFFKWFG
jgi:hypothetical protein